MLEPALTVSEPFSHEANAWKASLVSEKSHVYPVFAVSEPLLQEVFARKASCVKKDLTILCLFIVLVLALQQCPVPCTQGKRKLATWEPAITMASQRKPLLRAFLKRESSPTLAGKSFAVVSQSQVINPRKYHPPHGKHLKFVRCAHQLYSTPTDAQGTEGKQPKWVTELQAAASTDRDIARLLDGTNGNPDMIEARMKEEMRPKPETFSHGSMDNDPPKIRIRESYSAGNMLVWVEFSMPPTGGEKEDFEEVIKAYFITGRFGGYNSLNLQLFYESDMSRRDRNLISDKAAEAPPACFHEFKDVEFKGKWARFMIDLGTADELAVDILLNLLIGFSADRCKLDQIVLGGEDSKKDYYNPAKLAGGTSPPGM